MHIDGVEKAPRTFEHIEPEIVGNTRRLLMSEVSGRAFLLRKLRQIVPGIEKDSPMAIKSLERLKELEHEGYQYEGAEPSFELEIMKLFGTYAPSFELVEFKVIVNEPSIDSVSSAAMIKIRVNGQEEITADEGDGPVDALDAAIRKALTRFYPVLADMKLTDYKVRVIDSGAATAARVRVLIESTDGREVWTTIGVSGDIIQASWKALVDSMEYFLHKSLN
jgi:2-isopropylmalate synthase